MAFKPLCAVTFQPKMMSWMRELIERRYRVQLTLDDLPVLMRSKQMNNAVRGYPLGFNSPPTHQRSKGTIENELFLLYNHLKFTVTYEEDASQFDGVRFTGFDVEPVSRAHTFDGDASVTSTTYNGEQDIRNYPSPCLTLCSGPSGEALKVLYSYDVKWIATGADAVYSSSFMWADR